MKYVKLILLAAVGFVVAAVAFWLALAFATGQQQYLALMRAGLLLLGLSGLAWAILWHKMRLAMLALLLLVVGFLTTLLP